MGTLENVLKDWVGGTKEPCAQEFPVVCRDDASRAIETTFRNFQACSRRPSHLDPPFRATPISVRRTIVLALPPGGPFTTIVSFTMPRGNLMGVINAVGQESEGPASFLAERWRIVLDGIAVPPWQNIFFQIWDFTPPTPLCAPIHLIGGQTVEMQARNIGGVIHPARAQMCGWHYPARVFGGDDVGSSIVD